MTDDFGSRGNFLPLPSPRPTDHLPTELGNRELSDVIVESFDSLTETINDFSKNLRMLTKGDVYDATKKAIVDSGLKGGVGGLKGNTTINVKENADIPELREYWKKKTESEIASQKRIEENYIKQQEKQLQAESNAKVEGFLKWTKEAMSSPLAFIEDFAIKKIIEPAVMNLSGGKKDESSGAGTKGGKSNTSNSLGGGNSDGSSASTLGTINLVALDDILTKQNAALAEQFGQILHSELGLFGKALVTTMGYMFSGGQSYTNVYQASGSPKFINDKSMSDISRQDDFEDEQTAYDDISDFTNAPEQTELGSALMDYLTDEDKASIDSVLKNSDDGVGAIGGDLDITSMLGGGGAGSAGMLPLLKVIGIVALVGFIADKIGDLVKGFSDFKKKLPKFLGGEDPQTSIPIRMSDDENVEYQNALSFLEGGDVPEDVKREWLDLVSEASKEIFDYDPNAEMSLETGKMKLNTDELLKYIPKDSDVYKKIVETGDVRQVASNDDLQKEISKSALYEYYRSIGVKEEDLDQFHKDATSFGKLNKKEFKKYGLKDINIDDINKYVDMITESAKDDASWNGLAGHGFAIKNGELTTSDYVMNREYFQSVYGDLSLDASSMLRYARASANSVANKSRDNTNYYDAMLEELREKSRRGEITSDEYQVMSTSLTRERGENTGANLANKFTQQVIVYQSNPQDAVPANNGI